MRSLISLLKIILIAVIPIVSCCISLSYTRSSSLNKLNNWNSSELQFLGSPPEKIEKLVAAEFYTVYVRTIDGSLYSCYWESPGDTQCWVKVEEVPNLAIFPCGNGKDSNQGKTILAPLPSSSEVIDFLQVEYCGTWAGRTERSEFDYFLVDTGEVLQWSYDRFHMLPPPSITQKMYLAVGLGLFVGLIIDTAVIVWWSKRSGG